MPRPPKTRSGRDRLRVLRNLCKDKAKGDQSTIEDGASVDKIRKALEELRGKGGRGG